MEDNMTLYDVAKQMVSTEKQIDPIMLDRELEDISNNMLFSEDDYYFLICPTNRQYVMMHINQGSTLKSVKKNLKTILHNRGTVLLIDKEAGNIIEFWLRDIYTNEIYMYQLTPYEVVEV